MKRNWLAMLVVAGGLASTMFGQQYPPQQYPSQYPQQDPRYQGYPDDEGYYDDNDPAYADPGIYAPAPPPLPQYAYVRPPMPGPGYFWVDGFWNFTGRNYVWVAGYWMQPPYSGGYWVRPRYTGGRFFAGFWGRPGPARNFRPAYRGPAPVPHGNVYRDNGNRGNGNGYRGNGNGYRDNRGPRQDNHGARGGGRR